MPIDQEIEVVPLDQKRSKQKSKKFVKEKKSSLAPTFSAAFGKILRKRIREEEV